MTDDISTLEQIARLRRADAAAMIARADTGHIGGAMSCMDALVCLFYHVMKGDDRFLLSKGHSVEGYYAILADLGYFPKSELAKYSRAGAMLIGHPSNKVPGVEMCTGALGHALSVGVGVAIAYKRAGRKGVVYVLMGDGEQAEGSVWEAVAAAAHYGLDNLCAIVDRNGLQISGGTEEVLALGDAAAKYRAFGWTACEIDGNSMTELRDCFCSPAPAGKPKCVVMRTVKGKGMPFAENKAEWHHKVPSEGQLAEAYAALGVAGVDW